MGRLQSDKTRLKEQCMVEARRDGRTCNLLDCASKTSRSLRKNIPVKSILFGPKELRAQYVRELSDLC